MACSRPARDAGYATPAAVVVSLSLAVIATAISGRSLAALELARADLDKTRAELALDGAQEAAALQISQTPEAKPLRWTASADNQTVDQLAEPEATKLSLTATIALDDADLRQLGASDPATVRSRLKALAEMDGSEDVSATDSSTRWRRCANSWISAQGLQTSLEHPAAPQLGPSSPGAGRTGEVWRLRASFAGGWVDDRTVRFSGDPIRPARIINRRFFKSNLGSGPCDLASAR